MTSTPWNRLSDNVRGSPTPDEPHPLRTHYPSCLRRFFPNSLTARHSLARTSPLSAPVHVRARALQLYPGSTRRSEAGSAQAMLAAAATAAGGSVVARWPRGAALGGRHCRSGRGWGAREAAGNEAGGGNRGESAKDGQLGSRGRAGRAARGEEWRAEGRGAGGGGAHAGPGSLRAAGAEASPQRAGGAWGR